MDRQCSSCGGFCKKSGCERENVKPKEWVGLTDEEIMGMTCECVDDGTFNMDCARDYARWIEDKLKEKNHGLL